MEQLQTSFSNHNNELKGINVIIKEQLSPVKISKGHQDTYADETQMRKETHKCGVLL